MTPSTSGDHDAPELDPDPSTRIASGLRAADLLVRLGDRERAFETYLSIARRYLARDRALEAVAVAFRALAVDSAAFTSTRVAAFLREVGEAALPLCRRAIAEHRDADRPEAALSLAEAVFALAPNDVGMRHELAELYAGTGRDDDAVALLDSTCDRLAQAGHDRDLIATARLLLRVAPGHAPTLRKLTVACLRLGRPPAALAAATRLVAQVPDDTEGLELLARVYVALDRPGEALDALERLSHALLRSNAQDPLEEADLALVRALPWLPDPAFHRGIGSLRARLRADVRSTADDPLAHVPDAPELLEPALARPSSRPPA